MKNKNTANNNTHNIPDLDIIDLDLTDLESGSDADPARAPKQNTDRPEASESDFIEDDSFDEAFDETSDKRRFPSVLIHIGFVLILIIILGLVFWRVMNYGTIKDLNDYESEFSLEVLDHIMPLIPQEGMTVKDDGKTTIVAFGNAPFADDRDSEDSLANIIEDMTGATVINCSVGDSFLAAQGVTLSSDIAPMDAFNFYWLTTAFCLRNNDFVYRDIFDTLGDNMPEDGLEAYETLMDIDFSTVDVIVMMYDGNDYLAGHKMYSDQNDTDIQQFTGNMCAGIDLIQETYPHIRIIVLSPTYAFAINEEGEYISSDQYRYGQDVLSTYVIKQFGYAYDRSVTFVDNLYGTITEDNARQYLTDNLHLNVEGRKLVAERFAYALNYFDKNE